MSFIAVYITHASELEAQKFSDTLVKERLVACANIFPMKSAYWWQGAIQKEDEFVTIVKTIPENWKALEQKVLAIHPYEVPCIMKIEVEANQAYEKWIKESVDLK